MKAMDFDLSKELTFNFGEGITSFRDSRLVIFDANSIGLLRQTLIDEFGLINARNIFLKFGYQNGYSDFLQMKMNYNFDSELDLLASGPIIHTWEGIVHAAPTELELDREADKFYFTGKWTNSYEADQHLSFNHIGNEPVCWTLMGYASGWCTAFWGKPLVAIEPVCKGMGHSHCEWKIQSPEAWGRQADPYTDAFKKFWGK